MGKLVDGRYPNLFVSGKIASVTGDKARHIRDRGLDKRYYQDMILELIQEHGPVSRKDIDNLLMDKLPEILTEKQKITALVRIRSNLRCIISTPSEFEIWQ